MHVCVVVSKWTHTDLLCACLYSYSEAGTVLQQVIEEMGERLVSVCVCVCTRNVDSSVVYLSCKCFFAFTHTHARTCTHMHTHMHMGAAGTTPLSTSSLASARQIPALWRRRGESNKAASQTVRFISAQGEDCGGCSHVELDPMAATSSGCSKK